MSTYVLFDEEGQIVSTIKGTYTTLLNNKESFLGFIEYTGNTVDKYVDPSSGAVLPQKDYSLYALPLPCTLTIEGGEYPCTEQPTLTFVQPGVYDISVDAGAQYLKKTFQFTQV